MINVKCLRVGAGVLALARALGETHALPRKQVMHF